MKKILLSLIFLIIPFGVSAEEIDQFLVDITVNPDATIKVTEAIQYDFGALERHGIIRDIPVSYGYGLDEVFVDLELLSVTDENGQPYPYEESGYYYDSIKIGDPDKTITGTHWYYLTYNVDPVINSFDTWDELYWNATGNYWDVPINYAAVTVHIPEGSSTDSNQATCYTGGFSSTESYCSSYVESSQTFYYETDQGLSSQEGLTIVAGFDKNIVTPPATLKINSSPSYSSIYLNGTYQSYTPQTLRLTPGQYQVEIKEFKYKNFSENFTLKSGDNKTLSVELHKTPWAILLEFGLPFVIFLISSWLLFLLWWTKGRDPKGKGSIYPIYEPPANLTPGEIGVIVDNKAHMHDLTASIIRFAVEGHLKIERTEEKKLLWGKKEDFKLHKIKDLDPKKFPEFEQKIWDGIFGSKEKFTRLSSLKNKFYTKLPKIKDSLYDRVVDSGYYAKRPDRSQANYIILAILLDVFVFTGSAVLSGGLASNWPIFFGTLLSIEIFFIFILMPRRTKKGAEMLEQILGFKMYLTHAEKYRLERLYAPKNFKDLYEKYLPYAIALGVETKWAEQFKDLEIDPDWYLDNTHYFHILTFNRMISDFNRSSGKTMTSAPNQSYGGGSSGGWSGSSGFSGGGFSGGGFGGGGGGSW